MTRETHSETLAKTAQLLRASTRETTAAGREGVATMADDKTMSLAELFEQFGITESQAGRRSNPIVREAYNALNNGAKYVHVFGKGTSDDMLTVFASAPEVISGDAVILSDTTTAGDKLSRSIKYRNSANAPDDRETYGKVNVTDHKVTDADSGKVVTLGCVVRKL